MLAPGNSITVKDFNDFDRVANGSSYATPHVTGTVALLQEFADSKIAAGAARWNATATNHLVSKAVLMNSADKLEDAGDGLRLGMTRDVLKKNGVDTWLQSNAYNSPTNPHSGIPLDIEMGAGRLNAERALIQFQGGARNGYKGVGPQGTVPNIGWDYGDTFADGLYVEYELQDQLPADSFVSITLAWDREVSLDIDNGVSGAYDVGDTFKVDGELPTGFSNLNLYLMPLGATSLNEAVASSFSNDMNLEHLFFKVPTTGFYEFWVSEDESLYFDNPGTDYSVAWWAYSTAIPQPVVQGDFSGDGRVDNADLDLLLGNFGAPVPSVPSGWAGWAATAPAIDNDELDWLLGNFGYGTSTAIPEPSTAAMACVGVLLTIRGQNQKRS